MHKKNRLKVKSILVVFTFFLLTLSFNGVIAQSGASAPQSLENAARGVCSKYPIENCESSETKNLQVGGMTFDCVYSESIDTCTIQVTKYPSQDDSGLLMLVSLTLGSLGTPILGLYVANYIFYKLKGKTLLQNKSIILFGLIIGAIVFVVLYFSLLQGKAGY
ncbi:MAG: hypothetical protein Q7K34_04630 [archaeon]|nr:hypothetical protein [archaeon]